MGFRGILRSFRGVLCSNFLAPEPTLPSIARFRVEIPPKWRYIEAEHITGKASPAAPNHCTSGAHPGRRAPQVVANEARITN